MNWLRSLRELQNMTQNDVANCVQVSRASYTNMELNKRRPSPEVAKRIAKALDFKRHGLDWTKFYEDTM